MDLVPRPLALIFSESAHRWCRRRSRIFVPAEGTISELGGVRQGRGRANEHHHRVECVVAWQEIVLSHITGANVPVADLLSRFFTVSASFLAGCMVMIFLGIYLAAEPTLYRNGLSTLVPLEWRKKVNDTSDDVADALRLWLLGQLMDMLIVGVLSGVAVWLIGLPSPIALGVIAGVADFVPYVGPIVAAIPAVLVAVTLNLTAVFWTALAYLLIYQSEGQLIMPLIQQRIIFIPPALMLASIISLSVLFGSPATCLRGSHHCHTVRPGQETQHVRDSLGEVVQLPGEPD